MFYIVFTGKFYKVIEVFCSNNKLIRITAFRCNTRWQAEQFILDENSKRE